MMFRCLIFSGAVVAAHAANSVATSELPPLRLGKQPKASSARMFVPIEPSHDKRGRARSRSVDTCGSPTCIWQNSFSPIFKNKRSVRLSESGFQTTHFQSPSERVPHTISAPVDNSGSESDNSEASDLQVVVETNHARHNSKDSSSVDRETAHHEVKGSQHDEHATFDTSALKEKAAACAQRKQSNANDSEKFMIRLR